MTQPTSVKQTFDTLGVAPKLLSILQSKKFITPTPIQRQCIPEALKGKDIVGIAQTGTGKTLAFGLPLVQRLVSGGGQALVLVPTRELAIQADEMICKIGSSLGIKTAIIIGGAPAFRQMKELRNKPDIVIATPGRLLDHLARKNFSLHKITAVVLDEADRMFDIGFLPDIEKILSMIPQKKQILLFSATIPDAIIQIANRFMDQPVRIEIAPSGTTLANIEQEIFIIDRGSKLSLLEKVLSDNEGSVIIFSRTKAMTKKIAKAVCVMGHSAVEIHSERSLYQRKEAMAGFKTGKYKVLAATDIAARGIDVKGVSLVINYDLPDSSGDYVHRIGRTGRAGMNGKAISFATPDQRGNIKQIERLIRKNISTPVLPKLERTSESVIRVLQTRDVPERSFKKFNSQRFSSRNQRRR